MCDHGWLPTIVTLNDFDGVWDDFLESVYGIFKKDFIYSSPNFKGRNIKINHSPMSKGKEYTFWHIISEGSKEEERTPDLRRCEKISYIKPIIIEGSLGSRVYVWEAKTSRSGGKGRKSKIIIALKDFKYVVVLAKNQNDYFLITAYTTASHTREKLRKQFAKSSEFKKRTPF